MYSTKVTATTDFVYSGLASVQAYSTAFVAAVVMQPCWFAQPLKEKQKSEVLDRWS